MSKWCYNILTFTGNHRILYLVLVSSYVSVGKLPVGKGAETEILRITGVLAISLRNEAGDEERLVELIKLLSSGIFYLALSTNREVPPLDLTLCAQRAALGAPTDNRFFWWVSIYYVFSLFSRCFQCSVDCPHMFPFLSSGIEDCIFMYRVLVYLARNGS